MKKALLLLLIVGLILSAYYIHDAIYYRDHVDFLSPLDVEALRIRYDEFGDGHFGAKRGDGRLHKGVDLLAEFGTPVRARKRGWAVSKLDLNGYGNYVVVYHRGGFSSRYGHLEAASMRWIKKVRQGETIGWAGCTGNARNKKMEPHIHFEIRKDKRAVDPGSCLTEPIVK